MRTLCVYDAYSPLAGDQKQNLILMKMSAGSGKVSFRQGLVIGKMKLIQMIFCGHGIDESTDYLTRYQHETIGGHPQVHLDQSIRKVGIVIQG